MTTPVRFEVIIEAYPKIYESSMSLATRLNCKKDTTVNNWLDGTTQKINSKSQVKLCTIFGLNSDVWTKEFNTKREFKKNLKSFETITDDGENPNSNMDGLILDKLSNISDEEKNMLKKDLKKSIGLTEELADKSPDFMFEFAEKLKKDNRVEEALEVLKMIGVHDSTYKYTYHNELKYFKAILLSHENIKDWDGAIHLLKELYSSARYHLQKPELITLIASNYKRKALYDENTQELREKVKAIDINLLVSAITLYHEAYNLKDSQAKYYDAINIAYLTNIIDAIEVEYADSIEIETLYKNLTTGEEKWRIDSDSWWEVTSNAEFLMLRGKTDLAISQINYFLDFHMNEMTEFDRDATLRQLEIYIHFTQDVNGVRFYEHLKASK